MVAAALWLGCLAPAPPWAAAVALGVLGLTLAVAATRRRPGAAAVLLVVGTVLLGGGLAGGRRMLREASPLTPLARRHAVVDVTGRMVTEPRTTAFGAWAIVRVTAVDDSDVATRAVLHLAPRQRIDVGERVRARMLATPLPDGGFGAHLRTLGAAAGLRPAGPMDVEPAPAPMRWTTAVRDRARAVFDRALDADRAALLGGLVLGIRDDIDDDLLRDAGLSHLVVVSGRHVAVLLAGVLAIAALCGVGHRGRQWSALAGLWWFVVLTRWQPSVLRAAVMATLLLVGALAGRRRDALHSLGVTVFVLLLCDPLLARQAGFALSVLATGGVLLVVQHASASHTSKVVLALRVTVAAQLATAPVLLAMAGVVPLAALPANMVAAPAATVAQILGLCAAGLAAVGAPGAVAVAGSAGPPLGVLAWASTAFSGLPLLGVGALTGVVAAALLFAAGYRRVGGRAPVRWVVVTAGAVAVAVAIAPAALPPRAPTSLRLVVFDVGQGDALLVEAPDGDDGARMLIDGGPTPGALDAALRARRIRAVDAVVLTHGDHDHAAGLARALRRLAVGAFVIPAGDARLHDASASARDAVAVARRSEVPVVAVSAGQRFRLGAAQVEVLAPAAPVAAGSERNARSIVLRITGVNGSMLLTGDADATAQLRLLGRPDVVRADVLKVPHHGGATNADGFLDAVGARVAVVSVGADNTYGHPHPDTVADLAPVPLWRTDRHGTVVVTLTHDGPVVDTEHGR